MPLGSVICRRNLDEERGNLWICECPMCRDERLNGEVKDTAEKQDSSEVDREQTEGQSYS